jgi:hypothetical protein
MRSFAHVQDFIPLHHRGWQELKVLEWARYVCELPAFKQDTAFVEAVMSALSRHHGNMQQTDRVMLLSYLSAQRCIVTKAGLVRPEEAYFKNVDLFHDLPILAFGKGVSDTFARALGVRDMVDLQLVFDRLTHLNWDYVMLIKYLASVRDKLKPAELARLAATPLFPQHAAEEPGAPRYKAADLYAPNDALGTLDFPLLAWKGKWRAGSEEARLMETLGLVSVVPLRALWQKLHSTCAKGAAPDPYLQYFISHHRTYAPLYRAVDVQVPILPTLAASLATEAKLPHLAKPTDCFADAGCGCMGFKVLYPSYLEYASKFGVERNPSPELLLDALRRLRFSSTEGKRVFEYLAGRQADFSHAHWNALRSMSFIPVHMQHTGETTWLAPGSVFFGAKSQPGEEGTSTTAPNDPFLYVDFGPAGNAFLRSCGVQDQPTPAQLAHSLVKAPDVFVRAYGMEKYLDTLRVLASNFPHLSQQRTLLAAMKTSKFLVGVQMAANGADEAAKVPNAPQYHLAQASDIYLIDDSVLGQLFTPLS